MNIGDYVGPWNKSHALLKPQEVSRSFLLSVADGMHGGYALLSSSDPACAVYIA